MGKPLALVNLGWSLELGSRSGQNQSTLPKQKELAEKDNCDYELLPNDATKQYRLLLKLGDDLQAHDGLVEYFAGKTARDSNDANAPLHAITDPGHDGLHLEKIYTHYPGKGHTNLAPVSAMDPETGYPALPATQIDPAQLPTNDTLEKAAQSYVLRRNRLMQVFGAIMDPFRLVHALSLPPWTWEDALKRMTTFFHAGPIAVLGTPPSFNSSKQLERVDELEEKPSKNQSQLALPALPALQTADWAWLQP